MSITCSDPGFAELSFRLGKWGKGSSFVRSGVSFIERTLAKTAMTSPSLFSAISNSSVPSTVHVVLLASQARFPVPVHSKCCTILYCRTRLAGYSDVQVCLDYLLYMLVH